MTARAVEVEVKIADTEAFRAFAGNVTAAAEAFAKLSDEERAALPAAAREGIAALAGAAGRDALDESLCHGHVIIEWPAPDPTPGPRPLIGWKCSLFNADTGRQFYTCRKIEVHADVDHIVTADLTMFADEDGKPSFDNPYMAPDGNGGQVILEGTFRFLVTGMRIRP